MSDTESHFHAALARITAAQVLRTYGIDRSKVSVIDAFGDIMTRFITALGRRARNAAEHAGRGRCDFEDARQAMEEMGVIREDVVEFIQWCMSEQTKEMRRGACEGDETIEGNTSDWLQQLLEKQIKANGVDRFRDTIFGERTEQVVESLH